MSTHIQKPTMQERLRFRYQHGLSRLWARTLGSITRVQVREPLVALTFDDGPHPLYTPQLLDILARHQVPATFFCIGRHVRAHPDITQRAANAGHALANHTDTHPSFLAISSAERQREINACAATLAPFGGVKLFRPPRSHQHHGSRVDILRTGHTPLIWSCHGEDWRVRTADWMAAKVERELTPGQIILMHDAIWDPLEPGTDDRTALLAAVDQLLMRLRGRYTFVTVPELVRRGRPVREDWVYPKR